MPNMELKKSPMPVQDAYARICNFDEVALGYTYETAVNEAKRCLNCKHKPCVSGCPVEIDIPAFLAKVAAEDMEGAYEVLSRSLVPADQLQLLRCKDPWFRRTIHLLKVFQLLQKPWCKLLK